jgi:hypothetical protein
MAGDPTNFLKYCDTTKIAIKWETNLRKKYKSGDNWNCRYLRDQDLYLIICPSSTQKAEMVSLAFRVLDIKVASDVIYKLAQDLPPVPSSISSPPTANLGAPEPVPAPKVASPWSSRRLPTAVPRRVWRPPDDSKALFVDRLMGHWEVRGPPDKVEAIRDCIFRLLRERAGADIAPGETAVWFALRP